MWSNRPSIEYVNIEDYEVKKFESSDKSEGMA